MADRTLDDHRPGDGVAGTLADESAAIEAIADVLNWEVDVVCPPPTRSGALAVELRHSGRDRPMPIDDPKEELGGK